MGDKTVFVSSDVAGMHQDISIVSRIYAPVAKYITGLELLAIGNTQAVNKKINRAKELNFKNVSLHGRIGALNWSFLDNIKLMVVESQLLPTPVLLTDFGITNEILIHSPEAQKQQDTITKASNAKYIWVENDLPQLKGLGTAVNTVKALRLKGIKSGLMLDLCHAIGGNSLKNGNFNREWNNLKAYINNILLHKRTAEGLIWKGIHLPIGTLMHDSLPIDSHIHISNFMLNDIAVWIKKAKIERIVIENQNGLGIFGISEGMILKRQRRVERIFNRLKDHSII